ncbi:hypothetical protein [Aliikangiella maris]|uniref:Uncharacterized protein n=1 Tax=Aliikangiella maris TaxID=3162458 RepID=A0ABV3MMI2_9GAMM
MKECCTAHKAEHQQDITEQDITEQDITEQDITEQDKLEQYNGNQSTF